MIYLLALFLLDGRSVPVMPVEPWTLHVSVGDNIPRWLSYHHSSRQECLATLYEVVRARPLRGRLRVAYCERDPQVT